MRKPYIFLSVSFFLAFTFYSCKLCEEDLKQNEIYGCMDSTATNFNPDATIDDGSCDYCKEGSSFILISYDNGTDWEMKCLKQKGGDIIDISVVDSNNIWLCTAYNYLQPNAYILHSSD